MLGQFGIKEPEAFAYDDGTGAMTRDKASWDTQVSYAKQELYTGLVDEINDKLQEVETRLHDGQFYDDREYQGFQKDSGPSDGPLDYDSDGKLDSAELRDIADDLEG